MLRDSFVLNRELFSGRIERRNQLSGKSFSGWTNCLTLINPAPVCAYMIQTFVHTWTGWECSIFIETNVKRQSNPLPFKACSIQQCTTLHICIQPSTIVSKYDSEKCVNFGTTARVIRVNRLFQEKHKQNGHDFLQTILQSQQAKPLE